MINTTTHKLLNKKLTEAHKTLRAKDYQSLVYELEITLTLLKSSLLNSEA